MNLLSIIRKYKENRDYRVSEHCVKTDETEARLNESGIESSVADSIDCLRVKPSGPMLSKSVVQPLIATRLRNVMRRKRVGRSTFVVAHCGEHFLVRYILAEEIHQHLIHLQLLLRCLVPYVVRRKVACPVDHVEL